MNFENLYYLLIALATGTQIAGLLDEISKRRKSIRPALMGMLVGSGLIVLINSLSAS